MLNQQDMTEMARKVFSQLNDEPAAASDIAWLMKISEPCFELILTQLVLAGLSDYRLGCYTRLREQI